MQTLWQMIENRRISLAALSLAVLILIGVLAYSLTLWHQLQFSRPSAITISGLQPGLSKTTAKPLATWHLFGNTFAQETTALPKTHLQLELTGIMGGNNSSTSMAIIAMPGQPGQIYRVGDTIPDVMAKVQVITKEAVVLDNGGHLEQLTLHRYPLEFKALSTSWGGPA